MIVGYLIYSIRKDAVKFTNEMSEVIDKVILNEEKVSINLNKETIMSKLQYKLQQLVDILENDRIKANKEKDNIKELISDISHQIKTPIANINIYNDMLIYHELDNEKEKEFLNNMKLQISKLEWLVQALIKMSRLEGNMIVLNKERCHINKTIAKALSGVYLKAEEKNIEVKVYCDNELEINHDKKWVSEALFNIIENAVKYTPENGLIEITVDKGSLFSRIDIKDIGIGIFEKEINNIFKRFYRSEEVKDLEGIGIGLYLSNEIIIKHGGYIKVLSTKGKGSTFSIFLQN